MLISSVFFSKTSLYNQTCLVILSVAKDPMPKALSKKLEIAFAVLPPRVLRYAQDDKA
jgi:hypothetical protein